MESETILLKERLASMESEKATHLTLLEKQTELKKGREGHRILS